MATKRSEINLTKMRHHSLRPAVIISMTYVTPQILTYGYGFIEPQIKMVLFWESWSFHYHGNWNNREKI